MRAEWVEVDRFPAVSGSRARDVVAEFVRDTLNKTEWHWLGDDNERFQVGDTSYRIELAGANSDQWRIDELKVTGSKHG